VPSQTFTHEARTSAPLEEVWSALDRPETWEAIGGVDRVFDPLLDEHGRLSGFSFDTVAAGKKYIGTATPHDRVEGRRMAWRIENTEVRGVTTVELHPDDGGTWITVAVQVQSAGLLSSMFFPVIAGAIGDGMPRAIDDFAAGLEE
jgi:carbon monoxide dehydrogenase subunit G